MSLPGHVFAWEKVGRSGKICRWPFLTDFLTLFEQQFRVCVLALCTPTCFKSCTKRNIIGMWGGTSEPMGGVHE
jgi:hypothetical protein